ncbi:MAG: lincosamide nucleotidyltransferase [Actinomycetota bacterium]|jgi:lincosamide nucleotidyltransferase A/C/D/E|nr:lincosamide nucleotidyltransferase [Actinomycetota bacterium]
MAVMTAQDAKELLDLFEDNGAVVWVDGGWGVDAALGEQTRSHGDLDIVLAEPDVEIVVTTLEGLGYTRIPTPHDKPWNFVLGDAHGHEVDLHVFVFDEVGDGIYGPPENGDMIPGASLTGQGKIDGRWVRCISPEWQVRYHTGYEWDENDRRDMEALAERFQLVLPEDPREKLW